MGWAEQLLWPIEETTAFLPPLLYSQWLREGTQKLTALFDPSSWTSGKNIYIYIDLMRLVQIKLMRLTVCFWNL